MSSVHFLPFFLGSFLKNSSLFPDVGACKPLLDNESASCVEAPSSMYLVLSWGVLNQQFSNVVHDLLRSPRPFQEFWEVTTNFKGM